MRQSFTSSRLAGRTKRNAAWAAVAVLCAHAPATAGVEAVDASETAATNPPPDRVAVMRRDVFFPAPATNDLVRLEKGDRLTLAADTGHGFVVLCPDVSGGKQLAFLPYRGEWGHVTAQSWTEDVTLPEGSLRVRNPVALKPGFIPLLKGRSYPVQKIEEGAYVVEYRLEDFAREVSVLPAEADLETLPPPAPPTREEIVAQALDDARALSETLQQRLNEISRRRDRLSGLLELLQATEIENARLFSELAASTVEYRKLADYDPSPADRVRKLSRDLDGVLSRHAELGGKIREAQLRAEPLRLVSAQWKDARLRLEELKTQVANVQARLEALTAARTETELEQDRERLVELLAEARAEYRTLVKTMTDLQSGHASLKDLLALLPRLKAQNEALSARIEQLTAALEAIRQALADPENITAETPAP